METNVYICSMEPSGRDVPDILKISQTLSPDRQEKIKKLRYEKDRLQALGAGLLLDFGLQTYGLRERDLSMAYGSNGKPYLRDYPDIHFNLSHSGSLVMAVFSDLEVGCDIERIQTAKMKLARRFFAEPELAGLEAQSSEEQKDALFYRIWTLKESYIKATGEGMRTALDSFTVYPEPSVKGYAFQEFPVPGYSAAICQKTTLIPSPNEVIYSFQNLWDVV